MSDQYSTRRGLSVRTGPAADIALGAWNGAATNDPAQMISGAVHAAEKAVPAAIAAEGVNAAGRFLGQVPREIDRVRQGLDYERIQPWLRENARQLSAQELGFRTRPLTPIPPRATVGGRARIDRDVNQTPVAAVPSRSAVLGASDSQGGGGGSGGRGGRSPGADGGAGGGLHRTKHADGGVPAAHWDRERAGCPRARCHGRYRKRHHVWFSRQSRTENR